MAIGPSSSEPTGDRAVRVHRGLRVAGVVWALAVAAAVGFLAGGVWLSVASWLVLGCLTVPLRIGTARDARRDEDWRRFERQFWAHVEWRSHRRRGF